MYLIGWPVELAESRAREIVETGKLTMGWAPPHECKGVYAISLTDRDNEDVQARTPDYAPLPYLAEVESFEAVGLDTEEPRWKWNIKRFWSLPESARVDAWGSCGFTTMGVDFRDVVLALKKTPIEIARA